MLSEPCGQADAVGQIMESRFCIYLLSLIFLKASWIFCYTSLPFCVTAKEKPLLVTPFSN